MCAKTFGPLLSVSASGQIGKSLIFQKTRGFNVVRQYFQPRYTESATQCDQRLVFACTAQAIGAVDPDRPYLQDLQTIIPQYETWPSFVHRYVFERFGSGHAAVLAIHAQYTRLNEVFLDNVAEQIQFRDMVFLCATDGGRTLTSGASIVLLIDLAFHFRALHPNLFNRPVYSDDLESWTFQDYLDFKSDFTDRVPTP